jgi:hypothetical protein
MSLRAYLYALAVVAFVGVCAEPAVAKPRKAKRSADTMNNSDTKRDDDGGSGDMYVPAKTERSQGSSWSNRRRLNVSLLGESGLVDILQAGYGARAAFILNPRYTLELGYLQSDFHFFSLEYHTHLASSRLKMFLGNTFYVLAGLGYASINAANSYYVSSSSAGSSRVTDVSYETNLLIGEVALGNQWQWSNFTLGCDWVGFLTPLAKLSENTRKHETQGNGGFVSSDEKDDADHFGSISSHTMIETVRLYLGWSF